MAIEFPDFQHAAAIVDGAQQIPLTVANPFFKNDGFQAFDPASTVAPDSIKGGFTKAGDGDYLMRTLEGIDFLESILYVAIAEEPRAGGVASMIPPVALVSSGLESEPDSTLLQVLLVGQATDYEPADFIFTIQVIRMATGGLLIDEVL